MLRNPTCQVHALEGGVWNCVICVSTRAYSNFLTTIFTILYKLAVDTTNPNPRHALMSIFFASPTWIAR